jgi:hypothetical protein
MSEVPCKNCIVLGRCKARLLQNNSLAVLAKRCSILLNYIRPHGRYKMNRYNDARIFLLGDNMKHREEEWINPAQIV